MHSTLSKELRKKYGIRSIRLRVDDKIKVMKGQFKGHTGKVERIDMTKNKVYVTKIEIIKKDGTKTTRPIDPSNMMITDLNLNDKLRSKKISKNEIKKKQEEKPKAE